MLETEPIELVGTLNVGVVAKGTKNYDELINKPVVNGVELEGAMTSADLGLQPAGSYIENETDPVFSASASAGITSQDITNWNNKSDFSGSYNDLTDKPTIPTKTSDLNNDSGFINKNVDDLTNYYDKTTVDSKVSSVYKYKGTVATYADLPDTGLTIGDVYNVASDGSNYAWTGTEWDKLGGDIDLSGYQTKIDSSHKLSADLIDDTSTTNKLTNSTEKTAWNAKYDKPVGGIPSTDLSSAVQTSLGKADTAIQDISGKQNIIQFTTMPTASLSNLGQIIQYIGTTNNNYINGYFYQCIEDDGVYSFENINVQTSSEIPTGGSYTYIEQNYNTTSNYFIFEGKKKGVYFIDNDYSDTKFYYKIKESDTNYSQFNGQPLYVCLYEDFDYDNAESEHVFGRIVNVNSDGVVTRTQIKKNNLFISGGAQLYYILADVAQTFYGVKTFNSIPKQKNTTAPTQNAEFTNKKYVDDSISTAIGNINTILATLTTPNNNS